MEIELDPKLMGALPSGLNMLSHKRASRVRKNQSHESELESNERGQGKEEASLSLSSPEIHSQSTAVASFKSENRTSAS